MNKIRRGLLLCNGILAIMTVFSYLSPFVDAPHAGFISLLGLTYSGQLLFHLLFMVFWILFKPRYAFISAFFLILEIGLFNHILNVRYEEYSTDSSATLSVATYNMQFSKDLVHSTGDQQRNFSEFLKSMNEIDVLCVQECGWRSRDHLKRFMNFPYSHLVENIYVGIYSKYPIVDRGILSSGYTGANNCIWVDVAKGQDTIRVYNTHLESNRFDGKVPSIIDQETPEKVSQLVLLGIVQHYLKFTTIRSIQGNLIRNHQKESPFHSIICGDFNDVPQSRVYQILSQQMNDTFKKKGFGMGSTLKNLVPGLRIDYILTSPEIKILYHHIFENSFSDHFLVLADLQI